MFSTLKLVAFLFALFLSLGAPLSAAAPLRAKSKGGLVVTGIVLNKKCLAWNKNLVDLRLQFKFTNASSQALILNKSDLEIISIGYFAFIDEKTNNAHFGVLAVDRLRGYMPEYDREIVSARPNSHFVILRPRQAYVFETTESVPLIQASLDNAKQSDEYTIDLELATWVNHAEPLEYSLRRRWARFGVLWSQTVWSQSVTFVFPRNRTCEP